MIKKEFLNEIKSNLCKFCKKGNKVICYKCSKVIDFDKDKDLEVADIMECFPLKQFLKQRFVVYCSECAKKDNFKYKS